MSTVEKCVIKSAENKWIMSKWANAPYNVSGKRHTTCVFLLCRCVQVWSHAFPIQTCHSMSLLHAIISVSVIFDAILDCPVCIICFTNALVTVKRRSPWHEFLLFSFGQSTFKGAHYTLGKFQTSHKTSK